MENFLERLQISIPEWQKIDAILFEAFPIIHFHTPAPYEAIQDLTNYFVERNIDLDSSIVEMYRQSEYWSVGAAESFVLAYSSDKLFNTLEYNYFTVLQSEIETLSSFEEVYHRFTPFMKVETAVVGYLADVKLTNGEHPVLVVYDCWSLGDPVIIVASSVDRFFEIFLEPENLCVSLLEDNLEWWLERDPDLASLYNSGKLDYYRPHCVSPTEKDLWEIAKEFES